MATPGSTPGGKLYVGWSNNRTNTIDGNGGSFDSSFPSQSLQQHGQPSSHEQAQYLGHQHSQNPPTYTPFLLIPKRNGDQQQQQQQPQQHHYHDPQRGNNGFLQEADPGGDERGASMVLSNPVPDYSVAAASSPFTLQAQAPHFQPRPRPLSQAYPRHPGQDLSQDPRQNYNLEWEYQQHQQQQQQQQQQQHYQQRQPYQHHDQYHDQQQQQHRQQQQQQQRRPQHHEQQSYRSGEGSDPRLSDLLPVPTEIGLLLSDHPSTSTSGSRDELQYQQQQHQQQPRHLAPYTNGGPSKGSDEDEYGDESGRGGEFDASGKKVRKRRRLKGELPRDYALRKYKCTECEQKFARPSALATHVLTHTKEKPFICGTCDRGFAVMSNLRRHCRVRKHDTTATQTDANLSSPPGALGPDASRWG